MSHSGDQSTMCHSGDLRNWHIQVDGRDIALQPVQQALLANAALDNLNRMSLWPALMVKQKRTQVAANEHQKQCHVWEAF